MRREKIRQLKQTYKLIQYIVAVNILLYLFHNFSSRLAGVMLRDNAGEAVHVQRILLHILCVNKKNASFYFCYGSLLIIFDFILQNIPILPWRAGSLFREQT